MKQKKIQTNCESCSNYIYDEDCGYYICSVNLDEDEMCRFLSGSCFECNYFQLDDEYQIVKKQN